MNTSLSKVLQEDLSCQLATVLRRYIRKCGLSDVELAIASDDTPEMITLQKGILALTRKWKNQLYMPATAETQARKRRGAFTVHFDGDGDGEAMEDADNESAILVQDDMLEPEATLGDERTSRKYSIDRYEDYYSI